MYLRSLRDTGYKIFIISAVKYINGDIPEVQGEHKEALNHTIDIKIKF